MAVDAPALRDNVSADLVVIGGGFTGCSAALHAAEQDAEVRLLEAETIGHGGSGRNVGLVNAGLWMPLDEVEQILGRDAGVRLNAALAEAPDLVFSLVERHAIECEAIRAGTLHCAHSAAGFRDLQNRLHQQRERGAPVELLEAETTCSRTGSANFHGALFDARAGTIQPLAYCRGLAKAAQTAGAVLHEESGVKEIARVGCDWVVQTATGKVRAKALLLATNGYHKSVADVAAPAYVPIHYFQMATKPIGNGLPATILPGREGCWDTATVMSSFRLDAAGRLIIGGVGALNHPGAGMHKAWARRKIATIFPALKNQPLEYAWAGRIAMTGDHLPKILRLGENAYSIFGYSGRGIGPATVFGKTAAEGLLGNSEESLPLRPIHSYSERFTSIKQIYYEFGATVIHSVTNRSVTDDDTAFCE